jgi:molybdenum cofactor biosynthesis protein A
MTVLLRVRMILRDNHGRTFEYIRIGVTDRCNLRCQYCMPAEGLQWKPQHQLASIAEYHQLFKIFSHWEIKKIRFTGGEPFIRKDFLAIVEMAKDFPFEDVAITTNGVLAHAALPTLKKWNIHRINFSLDTLDASRFHKITLRNDIDQVLDAIQIALSLDMKVSVNAVLQSDTTEIELLHMMDWAIEQNIHLRFIEEMPFNGQGISPDWNWNWRRVENLIQHHFPNQLIKCSTPNATAVSYKVEPSRGSVGYIPAYSRTFCGTCNRLRLTPEGNLHHCLYSNHHYPILQAIRDGKDHNLIDEEVSAFVLKKAINGFEAEKQNQDHWVSMAKIGG